MAKLPIETTETINRLKQQLLEIVDEATVAEFTLVSVVLNLDAALTYLNRWPIVAMI